jgi:HUS1 checkpoint protein
VFDQYKVQSLAENVINLEVPLQALHRALKSALNATSASIRLTKRDNSPVLCLTITTSSTNGRGHVPYDDPAGNTFSGTAPGTGLDFTNNAVERETIITQDIPIRVLGSDAIDGIHQPRTREPDVHIILPPLIQLKSVSDRFTKLAVAARASGSAISGFTSVGPRLEMAANMHGCLRIGISTDSMNISSTWTGLTNPELDPTQYEGDIEDHPSTRMRKLGDKDGKSEEGWAKVRIDGRDWSKVMSVGRLGANRVIACWLPLPLFDG